MPCELNGGRQELLPGLSEANDSGGRDDDRHLDGGRHGRQVHAPTRELLRYFDDRHRDRLGEPAVIVPGKDAMLLSTLWKSHGTTTTYRLIDDFFASDDDFIRRAGYTVGVFGSQAGKLLSRRCSRRHRSAVSAEVLDLCDAAEGINRQQAFTWFGGSRLFEAFQSYEWNVTDWRATKKELDSFRQRLRGAVAVGDEESAVACSLAILRWGGVVAKNGIALEGRRGHWIEELRQMTHVLTADHEPSRGDLMLRNGTMCKMNAGFVKIYSVLLDYFVILALRIARARKASAAAAAARKRTAKKNR